MSSFMLGFLPYINIPTRYIFADTHTIPMNEIYRIMRDVIISHVGIPNGIRVIIVIGDVNGIIDKIVANVELGSDTTDIDNTSPIIIGIITTL